MTTDLAQIILQRAYVIDGPNLDQEARELGVADWLTLISPLEFGETGTGGGCMMLTAELPQGHSLGITDGEVGLPTSANAFWVSILDQDGEEKYSVIAP